MRSIISKSIKTLPKKYFKTKEQHENFHRSEKSKYFIRVIDNEKNSDCYVQDRSEAIKVTIKLNDPMNINTFGYKTRQMTKDDFKDEKITQKLDNSEIELNTLERDESRLFFEGQFFNFMGLDIFKIVTDKIIFEPDDGILFDPDEYEEQAQTKWAGNFKNIRQFYEANCMVQIEIISNESYSYNYDKVTYCFDEKNWFRVSIYTNPKALVDIFNQSKSGKYSQIIFNFYIPVWAKIKKSIDGEIFFDKYWEDEFFYVKDFPHPISDPFSIYFSERLDEDLDKEVDKLGEIEDSINKLTHKVIPIGQSLFVALIGIITLLFMILWSLNK